jgi:hypothetical protein
VKAGEKPGYPRFRGYGWYGSFTFKQFGFELLDHGLLLSKIGAIKVILQTFWHWGYNAWVKSLEAQAFSPGSSHNHTARL